jgi:DNA-binding NarL/FixJ family response regulator
MLADDIDVYRPDVLVWDFGWEPLAALECFSELSDELGSDSLLPVLILLPNEERAGEAAALLRDWPAGGLLLRDTPASQLTAAISAIALGLLVFDPLLAVLPANQDLLPEAPAESLTPREREVLQLLAEGLANKMIAQQLGISDHTVKFHVNAIMTKLNAQSRTEAVVRATRLGLIML